LLALRPTINKRSLTNDITSCQPAIPTGIDPNCRQSQQCDHNPAQIIREHRDPGISFKRDKFMLD